MQYCLASSLFVVAHSGRPNGHAKSWENPGLSNTASTKWRESPQLFGRRALTCRTATATDHPGPGRLDLTTPYRATHIHIDSNSEKKTGINSTKSSR